VTDAEHSTTDTSPTSPPAEEQASGAAGLVALIIGVVALGLWAGAPLLIVILALVLMIFLHELGHYLTAKWSGMKVTEFFLGFGPRIWSFRKGETEYGIKAIPAGAYVRVVGMSNLEEVSADDEPRTYRQQSYPRRLAVGIAGSAMHFLMALVCLYAVLVGTGAPNGRLFTDFDAWVVREVVDGSAAEAAGIEQGDRIVAIDGQAVDRFDDLREVVVDRPGQAVTLRVERDGAPLTLAAELGERDGNGFLGVGPGLPPDERVDPLTAIPRSFHEFGAATKETVGFFVGFFSASGLSDFGDQVADGRRDDPEPGSGGGGSDDVENRPVSIVNATRLGAQLTETGLFGFLLFFININVVVGIFNLIPLLPLDGGHVAIATYERIRSRNGRRYHADVAKLLPLTYAVVVALIVLGVTTLYLDLVNPIDLN
jgi:membrane-associated protease RseP (regulator of RpoE activity)